VRKITKLITESGRLKGRDANPGIRELSAAAAPTRPLSPVLSVHKKTFIICRLLRTGTHRTVLICTCVYCTGRGILIGHFLNMTTLVRKLLFHSVRRTAPLQNDMPYTVQRTVFCRTSLNLFNILYYQPITSRSSKKQEDFENRS